MQPRGFIGYDWFKLIVAVILALLLIVLGFAGGGRAVVAAPVLRAPVAGTQLPAGNVAFSGTGTPGNTIRVLIDGALAGQTQVGSDGTWTLNAPLGGPGNHAVVAQAFDPSGTVTAAAAPVTLTVAGSVPPGRVTAETATTIAMAGSATAESTSAATSTATTATVAPVVTEVATTGVMNTTTDAIAATTSVATTGATTDISSAVTAGATTDVTADTTSAATTGATSAATTSATADATREVTAVALDATTAATTAATGVPTTAGATGSATTQPPSITSPADGAQLPAAPFIMSGTGAPGSQFEILDSDKVLGTVTVAADGTWSLPVTPTAGTASYGVRAVGSTDLAGTPIRVTIGTPPPVCTSLAVGCEAWVTRERGLSLRLRSGVGTGATVVDRLPPGTEMTLLEGPQDANGYHWWRVRTPGNREGWVAGEELRLQPD